MSERTDALGMPVGEMRELGYWIVDRVVEHFERGADGPAIRAGDAAGLWERLGGPVPQEPGHPLAELETLLEVALVDMQHGDHPRYLARVPGPSSYAGVLGEWLGTGFNTLVASWGGGSGPATVELVVVDWLRSLLRMPEGTEGLLVSGGSIANLTALGAARHARGAGLAYVSDQTHSSVIRALAMLGFGPEEIRMLPTDDQLRLTAATLAAAVSGDRGRGLSPRYVVATAGTTNTGAVDELPEIAAVCARDGLWFHVDGAYGGPAALCERGRARLRGLELADSLVLDPHKWLFTPYDAGVVLVREPGTLERAFGMRPEYLADVQSDGREVDFGRRGPELSRRARAFKLWLIFRTYGLSRIAAAIEQGITLAERTQELIDADPGWECVTPAQLGIVTFTRAGWAAADHAASVAALAADGFAALTSTTLNGRPAVRLCTINPLTTEEDIAGVLGRLAVWRAS